MINISTKNTSQSINKIFNKAPTLQKKKTLPLFVVVILTELRNVRNSFKTSNFRIISFITIWKITSFWEIKRLFSTTLNNITNSLGKTSLTIFLSHFTSNRA